MEPKKRARGETVAIVLSIVAAAVLVISGVIVAAVLVFGTVINTQTDLGAWAMNYQKYSYGNSQDYTASSDFQVPSTVGKLDIDWIAGTVTFKVSDDGGFRVYESFESDDPDDVMYYKTGKDKLTVKFRKDGFYIGNLKKDLTVEIPETSRLDVTLNTVAVDIDFVSGDYDEVTVSSISGDFRITGSCEELDIKTVSGNTYCSFSAQPHDVEVDSISGNVEFVLPSEPEDIEIDTVSGNVYVNGAKVGHEYSSDSHGKGDIEVDTVSGGVTVTVEG